MNYSLSSPVEGLVWKVSWICGARTRSIIIFWVSVIMKRSQLRPTNAIYQKLKMEMPHSPALQTLQCVLGVLHKQ